MGFECINYALTKIQESYDMATTTRLTFLIDLDSLLHFFYVCIRQKVILERPTQSSIRCGNINTMTLSVFVSRS